MSQIFEIASSKAHSLNGIYNPLPDKDTAKEQNFVSSFETLLQSLKAEGKFQWRAVIFFFVPFAFLYGIAGQNFLLILSTPDHNCHVPGSLATNLSYDQWQNLTIPWIVGPDGVLMLSQCEMYRIYNSSDNPVLENSTFKIDSSKSIKCEYGWDYDNSSWVETPVTKFNWVCDDQNKKTNLFTLSLASSAIGTFAFPILSDRYGRKPMFFLTLVLLVVFGTAIIFSTSYIMFAVFKCLMSLPFYTLYQMPFLIVSEMCGQKLRSVTTLSSFIAFMLASPVVSFVAWLVDSWKYYELITILPVAIFFAYWRIIPESPRWLLSQGKLKDCEKIMMNIASVNNVSYTEEMTKLLKKAELEEKNKVSFMKIFSSKVMTKHLVLTGLLSGLGYSFSIGLSMNMNNMKGNIIVIFFIMNLFDLPGYILGSLGATYLGRRLTTILFFTLASVFVVAAACVVTDPWYLLVCCGMAKLFVGGEILAVYHQTGELFPTSLRATAYGINGIVGYAATVVMPKLMASGTANVYIPYIIMFVMSIISIVIASFLPETVGLPLPQTLLEANQVGKNQPYCTIIHKWNAHKYYPVQGRETKQEDNSQK